MTGIAFRRWGSLVWLGLATWMLGVAGCGRAPATPIDAARDQMSRHEFAAAADGLQRHLASEAKDIEAWKLLGQCRFALGDYQAAVAAYSEGLKTYPDDASLYLFRSDAYQRMGNVEAATADAQRGRQLHPDFWARYQPDTSVTPSSDDSQAAADSGSTSPDESAPSDRADDLLAEDDLFLDGGDPLGPPAAARDDTSGIESASPPRGLFSEAAEEQSDVPGGPAIRSNDARPAVPGMRGRVPGPRLRAATESDDNEAPEETEPPKATLGPPTPRTSPQWSATPWNPQFTTSPSAAGFGPWGIPLTTGQISPGQTPTYGLPSGSGSTFSPFQTGLLGGSPNSSAVPVPFVPRPTGTGTRQEQARDDGSAADTALTYPTGPIWQNDVFNNDQLGGSQAPYYEPSRSRLEGTGYFQPRYDWGRSEWMNEPLSRPNNFR